VSEAEGAAPPPAIDVGAWLRAAREQAGLSIDAAAQQLKLAPRQVRALEEGRYADLPGRTFVRGFVRNYARLLKLDPEEVVAALPGADAVPALGGPSIGSTARPMGELPLSQGPRASWSRWAIPIALAAAVAVAAFYEWMRPDERARTEVGGPIPFAPAEPAPPAADAGTPLPNPLSGGAPGSEAPPLPAGGATTPADTSSAAPAPPLPVAPAPAEAPPAAPPANATPTAPIRTAATGEATLVIQYRASAWTQVKDASGQVLLVTDGAPGTSRTVTGTPPFDLVLGNASEASVTWRGQPFDLAPHVRANVARVRLP